MMTVISLVSYLWPKKTPQSNDWLILKKKSRLNIKPYEVRQPDKVTFYGEKFWTRPQ